MIWVLPKNRVDDGFNFVIVSLELIRFYFLLESMCLSDLKIIQRFDISLPQYLLRNLEDYE